ncbi:MAG: amino acid permease [Acidobacteria bacterium]|nr:amino acid permease [Acidobacteriota bacterium]
MSAPGRPELQRSVKLSGFFALAFGSMIGVGWVTALGSWLAGAGPGGAIAAFVAGGGLMLLVGLCYAELTPMLPVAGGEVAYAYAASGTGRAFVVGWFLAFGYLSVSAFEAISVGRVLSYLLPAIDAWPLYTVAGEPVYGAHLLLGVALTAAITGINYRGVQAAAALQTWLTAIFVALTVVFVGAGLALGDIGSVRPWLAPGQGWGGFLGVFVTIPFWFVGFDTIPQAAEEAEATVSPRRLGLLILASIGAATAFYAVLVLSVSMTGPWQSLVDAKLPTAEAFERALGAPWLARAVLLSALLGLLTSWNGFFLAGSRVLFALGRGGIATAGLGVTHARYGSPSAAVLLSGAVTLLGALLGRGALLPFVNVGSFCIAVAFLGVAVSTLELRRKRPELPRPYRPPGGDWPPRLAAVGAAFILGCMVLPASPAALAWPTEWLILGGFLAAGAAAWKMGAAGRATMPEDERKSLILGR